MPSQSPFRPLVAPLVVLAILQGVMLAAMLARVPPHPPFAIPLFGMGPWLGAALSAIAVSLLTGAGESRTGRGFAVISVLMALVSFGPHKWVDAAIGQIWPSVLAAQVACVAVGWQLLRHMQQGQKTKRAVGAA